MSGSQQPLVGYGAAAYKIANSLRFRSSASAYLSRTPASAGNRTTWTYSVWHKRGQLGTSYSWLMNAYNTTQDALDFSVDRLDFWLADAVSIRLTSTAVFRDPSAWYHIVLAFDSTQATASNRIKMYVNGVQLTSFSTANYPSQNYQCPNINNTVQNEIGYISGGIDGYMADINFIDGQALDPTSFGQINATTGVWGPKNYAGTYGTNGFHLPFNDGSSATPTGLGKDTSGASSTAIVGTSTASSTTLTVVSVIGISIGNIVTGPGIPSNTYVTAIGVLSVTLSQAATSNNVSTTYTFSGNNWICNNISLTAGSTYDWMIDSPTPYQGTSYGVGNYCVLNPLDSGVAPNSANLNWVSSGNQGTRSTIWITSGKWYWEYTSLASGQIAECGVAGTGMPITGGTAYAGSTADSWGFSNSSGNKVNNNTQTNIASAGAINDVLMVAVDRDSGKIWWGRNGTWFGSGDPASGANAAFSNITVNVTPAIGVGGAASGTFAFNFGQRPFAYTPPSGYKSLCTYNLPTPTIQNGSNFMAATIWNGDGAASRAISNAVNGIAFQPDFTWIKCRNSAQTHVLQDVIRGTTLAATLGSQSTAAEGGIDAQNYGAVTAYGSNGFTVGQGAYGGGNAAYVNYSGFTYVGWQWKAGGTAVTNTAGSITSSVSANTTAGFSVVTYSAGASNSTVGHGLGVAPSFIIAKSRNNIRDWVCYHVSLGVNSYLLLDTTDAAGSFTNYWGSSATTFSVSTNGYLNNIGNMVAYCFAAIPGYSAFGSYTGNGSSDGPFVYCGFMPRFLLVKDTTNANNWQLLDTSRDTYNVAPDILQPNLSNAESAFGVGGYDFLSNGFKVRTSSTSTNTSGATIIYACFAENPFTNALAR